VSQISSDVLGCPGFPRVSKVLNNAQGMAILPHSGNKGLPT
jgi:hypothetical protein